MHAFRQLIQEHMDAKPWSQAELARASGLSAQLVSKLLSDDRDQIDQMPDRATISALADAFGIDESVVLIAAARAFGVPVESPSVSALGTSSNQEILDELQRRLVAPRHLRAVARDTPSRKRTRRRPEPFSND